MIGVGCGARREMEGLWNKNRYGWAVEQEERWREGVDANTCVLLRKGRSCVTMTCADTMYSKKRVHEAFKRATQQDYLSTVL
jgi:hypothetical protein